MQGQPAALWACLCCCSKAGCWHGHHYRLVSAHLGHVLGGPGGMQEVVRAGAEGRPDAHFDPHPQALTRPPILVPSQRAVWPCATPGQPSPVPLCWPACAVLKAIEGAQSAPTRRGEGAAPVRRQAVAPAGTAPSSLYRPSRPAPSPLFATARNTVYKNKRRPPRTHQHTNTNRPPSGAATTPSRPATTRQTGGGGAAAVTLAEWVGKGGRRPRGSGWPSP